MTSDEQLSAAADQSAETAKLFAADIVQAARQNHLDTPVVVMALAQVFAALLVEADSHVTIYEAAGLGLVGPEERIAQHVELIQELAATMRAAKAECVRPVGSVIQ